MTPSGDGLSRLSCEIISSANRHRQHDPQVARCVVVLNPVSRRDSDSRRDRARRFLNHGLGRSLGTVSISSDQLRNLLNTSASPLAGDAAPCPRIPFCRSAPELSPGRA
jgi:hypothetical protein